MTIVLRIVISLLNIIYFFLKLFPTSNKILFMSRQSNDINLDFSLLKEKLEGKYKLVFLCKTLDGKEQAKISTMISYGFHMFKQMYHLATSKVCILNTYIPTVSILKHKKELTIIQMWHSIGTMKKFGYTALDKEEGNNPKIAKILKMHNNYNIVFSSSEAYKNHLASGFNISKSKILTYTLPRIDLLLNKDYENSIKKNIYQEYPMLNSHKKNVIYAPTFRKNESFLLQNIYDLIKKINLDKYNLIIKLHPLSKIKIEHKGIIVDNKFSTFNMLFIADSLISDYSCIIYEAGIRNIPIYFYAFDLEQYEENRGLAIDYQELPGYTANQAKDLVSCLEKKYDYEYLHQFINKYIENTKHCTEKVVELIETKMK